MTKLEKAHIIMETLDEAYPLPGYFEEDIRTAIVKALVIIEKQDKQNKNH